MKMSNHVTSTNAKDDQRHARHLAILTRGLAGGGVQRMMRHTADELAARGFKVDLLIRSAGSIKNAPANLQTVHLRRWPRSVGRVMALRADPAGFREQLKPVLLTPFAAEPLGLIPGLTRYLREQRPDGLISATTYMNLASIWARQLAGTSTRLLVSERDNLSQNLRTGRVGKSWRWRHLPRLLHRTYPMADAIIGVSEGVSEDIERLASLPPGLVKTVYNPILTDDIPGQAALPVDDPWLTAGGPPVVLAAGRLVAKKDYPMLLRGFARLRQSRELKLIILGKGPDLRKLQKVARNLSIDQDVRFVGWIDNVYAYMARASVFALTSMREGLPGVLIQALACGCPVVSTDCPSGPAEILDQGRVGRLVEIGDDASLAEALAATIDNPPSADRLRQHVAPFTAANAVDGYLDAMGFARAPSAPCAL
ncbi:MAG: glycosyltransferase [Pseudomonadota bacterium]